MIVEDSGYTPPRWPLRISSHCACCTLHTNIILSAAPLIMRSPVHWRQRTPLTCAFSSLESPESYYIRSPVHHGITCFNVPYSNCLIPRARYDLILLRNISINVSTCDLVNKYWMQHTPLVWPSSVFKHSAVSVFHTLIDLSPLPVTSVELSQEMEYTPALWSLNTFIW